MEYAAVLIICARRKLYVRSPCLFTGFTRVYMFHRSNALSFVRKYGLEFFQPLAAPPTHQKPRPTDTIEPSYGVRAVPCAETRKQYKCTRRGAGVAREPSGTTSITEHKERAQTEAVEPSYGGTRRVNRK